MAKTALNVTMLSHTPDPEVTIALAGRLCYSDSHILDLREAVEGKAQTFVKKLMDLGHLSPLEHASFTFGAEGVSRSLLAQITRHRIASFSVQSQRYVKQTDADYILPPSIEALGEEEAAEFQRQMDVIQGFYGYWLDKGIKAEDARFVLPNASETRMVFTMNTRELLHFFNLRCCDRAQWEIRALAWAMLGLSMREAPFLFENAGPSCIKGACPEGKMSCGNPARCRELNKALFELAQTKPSDSEILDFVSREL